MNSTFVRLFELNLYDPVPNAKIKYFGVYRIWLSQCLIICYVIFNSHESPRQRLQTGLPFRVQQQQRNMRQVSPEKKRKI